LNITEKKSNFDVRFHGYGSMGDGSLPAEEAEALIPRFEFERLLNQGNYF
jgi:hypothetical protein